MMNEEPKNQEPLFPDTKIVLVAPGQAEFSCPLAAGSVMELFSLTGHEADLIIGPNGESFVLEIPEKDLEYGPWAFCKRVWDEMASRGHVPEKFPGITVA